MAMSNRDSTAPGGTPIGDATSNGGQSEVAGKVIFYNEQVSDMNELVNHLFNKPLGYTTVWELPRYRTHGPFLVFFRGDMKGEDQERGGEVNL